MGAIIDAGSIPVIPLYEQEELHQVTGGTLRPGGIALTAEMLTWCNFKAGSTMLDVGCGPGHTAALMASTFGLQPTGLDPSAAMLAKAARHASTALLLQGTATAIPCGHRSFEGVISECVLSLAGDIKASLREMYRVLRPGGLLLLTDIYRKQPQPQVDLPGLKSCITHALPLEEIKAALLQAGFTLLFCRDRSDLLKQLAGQIIFTFGSLEKFWQLFMGIEAARQTCCALSAAPIGYYALVAQKEKDNG